MLLIFGLGLVELRVVLDLQRVIEDFL